MSLQSTIHRQSLIVEHLKNFPGTKLKDILVKLHDRGFELSERTLKRDIEDLRNEYGLKIDCNKSENTYSIDLENSIDYEYILKYLDIAVSAQLMLNTLKDGANTREYVLFGSENTFKGIENLKLLLTATKECKQIEFVHESYQNGKTHKAVVNPYLLKEYQGRWYVYGENIALKEFRTYGLDRITGLVVTNVSFQKHPQVDPAEEFSGLIGVSNYTLEDEPMQNIILSFSPEQGRYFRSLPWLPVYEVIADNETEFRISLYLLPNYELLQKLLMHSDTVTVIEPQWLIDKICAIQKKSLKKYRKIK